MCFFITVISVLALRLIKLQLFPSMQVVNTNEIYQSEKVSNTKFNLIDCNGKDLLRFKKKYILVIDKKPFSLNNYEETLENLLNLNFIMQEECKNFNFQDVLKSEGKKYYDISEEAYNKIKQLNNIKGIYTYEYKELNKKEAWSVEGMITGQPEKYKIIEGSFDEEIYNYNKDNNENIKNFSLDEKSIYSKETDVDKNNKIQLTIDEELQDKIREVLNRDEFEKFKNVGVLLMESDTGAVKAMVHKDETLANVNFCIEGMGYEPGSVYKLITLGGALEEGKVGMNDIFTCTGKICKEGVHGKITVRDALIKSCNDVFAAIGEKLGYEKLMEYSEKLGLFSPVLNMKGEGRNEASGIKPDEDMGMTNISIGQCITVTPIQVLGFTNAFVNDGVYIKPHIIDKILDSGDNVKKQIETQKEKVFSSITSKLVKNTMIDVVSSGTGKKAAVEGTIVGGKTGSATGSNNTTHGWFTGYFTINNKTYTMTVFVPDINGIYDMGEEAGGGNTAAPIFGEIVKEIK